MSLCLVCQAREAKTLMEGNIGYCTICARNMYHLSTYLNNKFKIGDAQELLMNFYQNNLPYRTERDINK